MAIAETYRDRALKAEARILELEAELAEWRCTRTEKADPRAAKCAKLLGYSGLGIRIILTLAEGSAKQNLFSHRQLEELAWGGPHGDMPDSENNLRVHILRARRRLASLGFPDAITNIRGHGYFMPILTGEALKAAIDAVIL